MTYVKNEQTNKWEVHFTQQQHALLARVEEQEKKLKELLKKKLALKIDVKHNEKEKRKDKNGNDSFRTVKLRGTNTKLRDQIIIIQYYLRLIKNKCQRENEENPKKKFLYKEEDAKEWNLNSNTVKKLRLKATKEFEKFNQEMIDFELPDFEEEL